MHGIGWLDTANLAPALLLQVPSLLTQLKDLL
jgi:hypothetical protein